MMILGQSAVCLLIRQVGWGEVEQLNRKRRFFLVILKLYDIVELWKCSLNIAGEEGGGAIFVLSVTFFSL